MQNAEWGMRSAECGVRNAEWGISKGGPVGEYNCLTSKAAFVIMAE